MRMFVLTGLKPSYSNPIGGIFITRRLQVLRKHGIYFTASDIRTYYGFIRKWAAIALKKIFGKTTATRDKKLASSRFLAEEVAYDGIAIPSGLPEWLYETYVVIKIAKILKNGRYDLVHAHCTYPEGYLAVKAASKRKIPVVITSHGGDIQVLAKRSSSIQVKLVETLNRANRAIFVSQILLDDARKLGYSANNSIVIPNGYSANIFSPKNNREMRYRHGIALKKKVIGFVGGLVADKRADCFFDLFSMIKKIEPEAYFIVIGDGPFAGKLRDAKEHLSVHMTGFLSQNEVAGWMATFDVLILPSRVEGWGCVIKEAQAMGVPCVGSDSGGIPEAIGSGGVIVKDSGEDFIEDFARAVVRVLKDPLDPKDVIKSAQGFTWEETVGKEVAVYTEVISEYNWSKM